VPAVDGVDLTIAPGEVVALLGSNGAGKSTVVDMLLGLTRPDAGTADPVGLAGLPAELRAARRQDGRRDVPRGLSHGASRGRGALPRRR